jgi:crotonobetainyl-CoA:carnitine CoA-transferase CaiB-like acyl-CoA transferase
MIKTDRALPLSGIRVLELGHAVMGPTCGLILGDMGAEVIKVERAPDGDDTRRLIGFGSGFFPFFNRNKKSITIDLKSEKGKAVLRKLVRSADVFIENFAPGTVDRLGFGYDEVSRINPRLIYCSLKGFMKGPYENRPALDEVVQMMGGLAYMTGPWGQPLRCGASVIDIMGGSYGVIGILVGLYNREKTGRGEYVIASLYESTAFLVGQHMTYSAVSGKPAPPMPNRVSAWSIYDRFESKEGEMVFVGVTSDMQWKRFCETFGLSSLSADERLATNNDRIAQREWLIPELQQVFKKLEKSEILEQCEKAGIPFAPIAKPEDLFEDPHLNQSGSLVDTTLPGGVKAKLPKIPVRIGSHDFGLRNNPPRVGEGSREVLKSIGISDEEIDELQKGGTLAFSS